MRFAATFGLPASATAAMPPVPCALSLYFNKESSVSLSYANAAKLSKLSITESIAFLIAANAGSFEDVAALSFT